MMWERLRRRAAVQERALTSQGRENADMGHKGKTG